MTQPISQQPICILGMHRSGTSCLAGSLQEAGLFLGEVYTKAPYNLKGNRENRQIMALQESLLADNDGSWDSPPEQMIWHEHHQQQRDTIIAGYPLDQVWGFKDPRTLLTLEGWLDALPELRFVASFRHPLAVASSLQSRNDFALEKSLQLWFDYNQKLLQYQKRFQFPLICFDNTPEQYQVRLQAIVPQLGLSVPASGFSFFESALRKQHNLDVAELPPAISALYRQLEQAI